MHLCFQWFWGALDKCFKSEKPCLFHASCSSEESKQGQKLSLFLVAHLANQSTFSFWKMQKCLVYYSVLFLSWIVKLSNGPVRKTLFTILNWLCSRRPENEWFMELRSALYWDITQHVVVIPHWCYERTVPSSRSKKMVPIGCPESSIRNCHDRVIYWLTLGSSPYGPDAPTSYRRALCAP